MSHLTKHHQIQAGYGRTRQIKAAARIFPSRIHYNLREAVKKSRLTIRGCEVEFFNPYATGQRELLIGTFNWIDVVASHPTQDILAIDLQEQDTRRRARYAKEKARELRIRNIPYLVVVGPGLNAMHAEIAVWIRKLERGLI